MGRGLTGLQVRVLGCLEGIEPAWTLTGGGALVGFHLKHRTTRDLDLFLHGHRTLEDFASRVSRRLQEAGLEVRSVQSSPAMQRLQVSGEGESVVVDLVAEPVPVIEDPVELPLEGHRVRVDTAHEILVNKLCALVQRSEVRDLFDVQQLLAHGGDLRRAMADAPRKDGGFSPLTLAWLLEQFAIEELGRAEGWSNDRLGGLEDFRQHLLRQLKDWTRPEA